MEISFVVFPFIIGLVLGSFFNVVGLRVPKNESIVEPPSHCSKCKRRLTPLDLIPVVSYLCLRGRCRTCGTKISPLYLWIELLTGILFTMATYKIGFTSELAVVLLFISLLIIIVVSDIVYMIIPDKILLFFLPFLILGRILVPLDPWWDSVVGAIIGFGMLYFIAFVSKGGIGGGDIKLFFLIGLVLGWKNTILTLFLASIIGLIIGIITLKVRAEGKKTPFPFGPAIAISAITVYFYGDLIVKWYIILLLKE
ncbi:prepilin peptidase [Ureibacillus sp. 179-F W5.1 NHS]|uniref:Prepilin peptidase n=1 Tax=Lysinibacillus halotolerans TaxID=1368476 RepID=A0A3M8HHI9_9BACI|nr:A24 family peptidase [Lysinibacillus halotolerans]RND01847.1 prepilin peptidase [Lysinibacillus halotolerans]